MIIDQVIKDPTGRNLVVQGSAIDDYIISSLLKLGIMSVYIREGSADPDDPEIRMPYCLQRLPPWSNSCVRTTVPRSP